MEGLKMDRYLGTLAQWSDQWTIPINRVNHSTYIIVHNPTRNQSWTLFHLSDYAVSSISGPVYWLVPRI